MLNALRRNSSQARLVRSLHGALSSQARNPVFFLNFGVADTLDGRFDLVALHAWLVFERLRAAGMGDTAQALSDAIFIGFDEALRDLGAGDMSMGRKIKQMGEAFNGRIQAYDAAADEMALAAAILRNVYRGANNRQREALALAQYALAARQHLAASEISSGELDFGVPPQSAARS
jgi:cytochrome b pre-mRNA-processing protein 3